ncbi:MAG: ABC transporter substrate-binding protein [Planctomycetota bacterium]|nr:ABC transporter substrate-binding protein [Planctomycetota bacterium]
MNRIGVLAAIVLGVAGLFLYLAITGFSSDSLDGKFLRLAIDTDPKTLDPISITDTISDGLARKVFNGLVKLKKDGDAYVPTGDLAEKFEISPDGTRYTFWLRKGVKFHNGREVKASDFVYSIGRLLGPGSTRADWVKPFVKGSEAFFKDPTAPLGVKAVDDYTLEIELEKPFAPFIQHLCTVNLSVVPKECADDKSKPFARNPVGTGPFKFSEWKDSERVVLRRFDDYFKGRPKLDGVAFLIVKEPITRLRKYENGELHATDIPNGKVKEATAKAGPENVLEYTTWRTNYIGFGMPNGKYADHKELQPYGSNKLLRQAISYAIDREYLCTKVLEGRGVPAKGILPPGMPAFKEGRPGWPHDLEKAKALLAEAGYPEGKGLPKITLLHRNDENTKMIVQALQQDMEKIGVPVELQARDWNAFLSQVDDNPQPMYVLGWVADYGDPDNFLFVLFHTKQWGEAGNNTRFSNPKVDELVEKARGLAAMTDRAPLYHEAESIILDEMPWVPTYHVRNVVLLRKEVKGIREHITPFDTGTEFPQIDFHLVDIE